MIGTLDVRIHSIEAVTPPAQRPVCVIGLEGQEFRVEDFGRDDLDYTFSVGRPQSDLQLLIFDEAQSTGMPLGRIIVPVADVLWPTGEPPTIARLAAAFDKELPPFRREYAVQFLPYLGAEPWELSTDPTAADRFEPRLIEPRRPGHDRWPPFGQVALTVEVTLSKEVKSLLGLYLSSMILPPKDERSAVRADAAEEPASGSLLKNPDLRSILALVARLRHWSLQPDSGFVAWLREHPWHGYASALAWFAFCTLGFFPCSLWLVPIYTWLALLGNGLLVALRREREWRRRGTEARNLFWRETAESATPTSWAAAGTEAKEVALRVCRKLREAEPLVRTFTVFVEKVRNALTFADGPASIACFLILGGICVLFSASLFLLSSLNPGFNFVSGLYGAVALVALSRSSQPEKSEPLDLMKTANLALGCVPDQAELAHRFVASRVQRIEVCEV